VDRRNETDEQSRIGQVTDEKGKNGDPGGKADTEHKKAAIQHIDGEVIAIMA
jgi:hypothetical protein